jgi:hypothetical protein
MIAVSVLILSLLWLAITFGWLPPPGGYDSVLSEWVVISIDVSVFVLAVVAFILALRGRYPWILAIVFLISPICHAIGYFPWGELKILFFSLPLMPIILVVAAHFVLKALGHSSRVI